MNIFDKIPDRIFSPLAAPNRRFYAALLMHLYKNTFGAIGATPRKTEVLTEIGDFIERYTSEHGDLQDDPDVKLTPARQRALQREAKAHGGQDLRRYVAFTYLVDTGWLIEIRDRFRKLADLSPEGRMLLHEIERIANGDTRSYGGAVLNVLSNLSAAADYPDEQSMAVHNAWAFSKDFTQHLRTVSGQMRQIEDRILRHNDLRRLFKAFFEDFVTRYLIADYKTLFTKNNPFRFRHKILERVRQIEGDSLLLSRLADGYVREGRALNAQQAAEAIRDELEDVYRVFDSVDRQLDIITETQARIETRINTIVRYMDRHDGGIVDRVTQSIRALSVAPLDSRDDVLVNHRLVTYTRAVGGNDLYTPRPPKKPLDRTLVEKAPPDPAFERYQEEKARYAALVTVTPNRIKAFAEEVLADRASIKGSEIRILNIEDFVAFQRLREIQYVFDGYLSQRYRVTPLDAVAENDWLMFYDFILERAEQAQGADDAA